MSRPTSNSTVTNKHLNGDQQAPERLATSNSTVIPTSNSTVTNRSGDGVCSSSLCIKPFIELCMSLYIQRASSSGVPPRLAFDVDVYLNNLRTLGDRP
jgi:hypothetical protein